MDADVLDAVLHAGLGALAPLPPVPAALRAVAADGKTCGGAVSVAGTRVHLFSIVEHAAGVPLGQVQAPSEGFEIAAFATVLDRIDGHGVVVAADALHTQRAPAQYLHRHGGKYLFIAKLSQPPTMHAKLKTLPWPAHPQIGPRPGQGPRATREQNPASHLHQGRDRLPHAREARRAHRTRRESRTGRTRHRGVHAVTNLARQDATPAESANLVHGQWAMEDKVHPVRDTTFDEARS